MNISKLQKWGLIVFCIIGPFSIVYLLYSFTFQPNKENNGFLRKFSTIVATPIDTMQAHHLFAQICGVTDHAIFFQYQSTPQKIFETDWSLKKEVFHTFPLPYNKRVLSRIFYQVDSPQVNIFAGNANIIYKANINSPTFTKKFHYSGAIIIQCYALPDSNYLIYTFDTTDIHLGQEVITWNPETNKEMHIAKLFKNVTDGGIANDGILMYDSATDNEIYIPFFKNGIYLNRSKEDEPIKILTIDTVAFGKTQGGSYKENGETKYVNNTPQFNVNWIDAVSDGKAYVNCLLRSDNENHATFDDYSDIDVYDLKQGHYLYTFKIPRLYGKKIISFKLLNNRLAALYPDGIVTYGWKQ